MGAPQRRLDVHVVVCGAVCAAAAAAAADALPPWGGRQPVPARLCARPLPAAAGGQARLLHLAGALPPALWRRPHRRRRRRLRRPQLRPRPMRVLRRVLHVALPVHDGRHALWDVPTGPRQVPLWGSGGGGSAPRSPARLAGWPPAPVPTAGGEVWWAGGGGPLARGWSRAPPLTMRRAPLRLLFALVVSVFVFASSPMPPRCMYR